LETQALTGLTPGWDVQFDWPIQGWHGNRGTYNGFPRGNRQHKREIVAFHREQSMWRKFHMQIEISCWPTGEP
jgi:hypothetical protein